MSVMRFLFRDWTAANLAALAVLGAATVVCVAAAAGLVRPAALPVAAAQQIPRMPVLSALPGDGADAAIAAALDADPFGMATGYAEDAGEVAADGPVVATAVAVAPAPQLRLQGIALLPGGPRAVIAVGDRPARLLRPGQLVTGDLRIARVASEGVTIVGADTTFVLRLVRKGASPAPASPATVVARSAGPGAP